MSQPASAALLGYWNFNDATNPRVALDSSGRGNDGTVNIGTYTGDGGGHTGLAGDYALDFGTYNNGARVFVPSAGFGAFRTMTDNNEATVSLWIFGHSSQPQNNTAFGFYNGGDTRQFQSHLPWGNQNIYFDVGGCCSGAYRINKAETNPARWEGQWNYYTFVKDGGQSRIYQNGTLWHSGATSAPIGQIVAAYIGAEVNATNGYAGLIDDYAVWDEALSDTQIAALASGTATPADWAAPPAPGYAVNVAPLYGTATQSSTRVGSGGNAAFFAIDGDANGYWNDGSVTHTASNSEVDTWWQLDLGTTFDMEQIRLFNRADSNETRLSNFHLSVLDDSMTEIYGLDVPGQVDRFFGQSFSVPEGTEGRYVRVQLNGQNNQGNGILSLAEVQVVSRLEKLPNGINVAETLGFATQSSTRTGTGGNDASFAIDGDTDGQWGNDSVTHTNNVAGSWWQVDFGESLYLENVRLFGRRDCCGGRLGNFRLSVLDELGNEVYGEDVSATVPAGGQNFALPFGTKGSTVRVQLNDVNNHGDNVLQLAEAQVFGGSLANVARDPNAVVSQSGTSYGGDASRAVDGDTDGIYGNGSTTHSSDQANSWWMVELSKPASIEEIILFNREDCCGDRLSNFRLSVYLGGTSGTEVFGEDYFTDPGTSVAQGDSFRVAMPGYTVGDTIRIQLLGLNNGGNGYLSLAEVQVYGELLPEPSTAVLFAVGCVALLAAPLRRRKTRPV